MGDVKNLADIEALEKVKDLLEGKMCFLCTFRTDGSIHSRPMSVANIDEDGNIWFFSPRDSNKNREINQSDHVYIMFMEAGKQHYLTMSGFAEIVIDQQKVEKLWNVFLNAWFTEGKNDPNISLLKVSNLEGHYWDEKNGHLISMVKTTIAAITRTKGLDGSLQGDLTL